MTGTPYTQPECANGSGGWLCNSVIQVTVGTTESSCTTYTPLCDVVTINSCHALKTADGRIIGVNGGLCGQGACYQRRTTDAECYVRGTELNREAATFLSSTMVGLAFCYGGITRFRPA